MFTASRSPSVGTGVMPSDLLQSQVCRSSQASSPHNREWKAAMVEKGWAGE